MTTILYCALIVGAVALVAGVGLTIASQIMAVPVDERVTAVRECLPGANCGACGYSGCDGYAAALVDGSAQNGLCTPGGQDAAAGIAKILGTGDVSVEQKIAVVHCLGTYDNTSDRIEYNGVHSCSAAIQLYGGVASCAFGCVGLGDCASVCKFNAITVCNGAAKVEPELCSGCGMCVDVCPKKIITLMPRKGAVVHCSSRIKGGETRKVCKTGCLGCMKCVKTCPSQAITVTDFCASIDTEKCTSCGKCVDVCPAHIIKLHE